MSRLLCVAGLGALLFSFPILTLADTIDQSFTSPSNDSVQCTDCPNFAFAQTFTAGVTGQLTGVYIDVHLGSGTSFVLSINAVSGGAPTSVVLSSSTLPANSTFDILTPISIPAISIVAGQQYAIVLLAPSDSTGTNQWLGGRPDPYAGGAAYGSDNGGSTFFPLFALGEVDLHFQTTVASGVAPVPEPSTLALLATGIAAVGLRRKLRKARNFHFTEVTKF